MPWRTLSLCILLVLAGAAGQTAGGPDTRGVLHVMPVWPAALNVSDEEFAREVVELRARLPEGGPVRVGFSVYTTVLMDRWDVTSEQEAAANLTRTIAEIDRAVTRAWQNQVPVNIFTITPVRADTDPAQAASQAEDRRVMQWFSDGTLAEGWWTYSRYARRQYRVRELYVRALGRLLANRIAQHPDLIVAAAGDGEIELAFKNHGPPLADYSPFAVAEFRDWLRAGGLYGPGQPFAGQAYEQAARYAGDASPAIDSNNDGHTLNGDMGTSFTSWTLRYFDWQLSDAIDRDPRAIPEAVYAAADFTAMPDAGRTLFDPPRDLTGYPAPWIDAWMTFRESLVRHYNRDFARWMTSSPDEATGATIPASKWFSYQIPADYLFGHTPATPDARFLTSASSWRTADIRPYGGAGITSFNTHVDGVYYRTLASVAPLLAGLDTPWSIFEWNPSYPSTLDPTIYRQDAAYVLRYRPSIVAPFAWRNDTYQVLGSGFETALLDLIQDLRSAPWKLQLSGENSQVHLQWQPPHSGPRPERYVIEVTTERGGEPVMTTETAVPSAVLELNASGTFFVRVRGRSGRVPTPASEEVLVTFGTRPPDDAAQAAPAPTPTPKTYRWPRPDGVPRPPKFGSK